MKSIVREFLQSSPQCRADAAETVRQIIAVRLVFLHLPGLEFEASREFVSGIAQWVVSENERTNPFICARVGEQNSGAGGGT